MTDDYILNDFIYDIIGDGERETMTAPPHTNESLLNFTCYENVKRRDKSVLQFWADVWNKSTLNSAQECKH